MNIMIVDDQLRYTLPAHNNGVGGDLALFVDAHVQEDALGVIFVSRKQIDNYVFRADEASPLKKAIALSRIFGETELGETTVWEQANLQTRMTELYTLCRVAAGVYYILHPIGHLATIYPTTHHLRWVDKTTMQYVTQNVTEICFEATLLGEELRHLRSNPKMREEAMADTIGHYYWKGIHEELFRLARLTRPPQTEHYFLPESPDVSLMKRNVPNPLIHGWVID